MSRGPCPTGRDRAESRTSPASGTRPGRPPGIRQSARAAGAARRCSSSSPSRRRAGPQVMAIGGEPGSRAPSGGESGPREGRRALPMLCGFITSLSLSLSFSLSLSLSLFFLSLSLSLSLSPSACSEYQRYSDTARLQGSTKTTCILTSPANREMCARERAAAHGKGGTGARGPGFRREARAAQRRAPGAGRALRRAVRPSGPYSDPLGPIPADAARRIESRNRSDGHDRSAAPQTAGRGVSV